MKLFFRKFTAFCLILAVIFSMTALPVSAGWIQTAGRWSYTENSVLATGWKKIGGSWYYFNGSGIMQTGWKKLSGVWYYLKPRGAMQTGWAKIGGRLPIPRPDS